MSASVEDTVKVDGVYFPASRDSRYILIQASDQGYMTRPRFGRYSCVGHSECAMLEDSRAQKRRKRSRNFPIRCFVGIRGRVGEVLEGFVGAQTVAWEYCQWNRANT